ncbi:MAG: hypothetical protein HYT80_01925 [Euryarchaeota archaeon]|nr:hypothetical protein [Euryarchaeota archaeon]
MDPAEAHSQHRTLDPDCPHCLVRPSMARSAKFAWAVTAIATGALVVVLFLGFQSRGGLFVAGGGLFLVMMLACPLVMGGMMWMMMRGHQH